MNCFLLGAAKCGTTTLANWMSQHPDICVSQPKEPRFFLIASEYIKGVDYYKSEYFAHYNNEPVVVDCHPYNMYNGYIPARIAESVGIPNKVIVCYRDPVVRAYSDWAFFKNMRPGREIRTFDVAIQENEKILDVNWANSEAAYELNRDVKGGTYRPTYIEHGMYFAQMLKYFQLFDGVQYHFINLDDMAKYPMVCWMILCDFLELPFAPIKHNILNIGVKHGEFKFNEAWPNTIKRLRQIYEGDVLNLSEYLNRNLIGEWWHG